MFLSRICFPDAFQAYFSPNETHSEGECFHDVFFENISQIGRSTAIVDADNYRLRLHVFFCSGERRGAEEKQWPD